MKLGAFNGCIFWEKQKFQVSVQYSDEEENQ